MALTPEEQFVKLASVNKRLLIVLPEDPSGDMIGSGYGVTHFFTSLGSDVTLAFVDHKKGSREYDFLVKPEKILHSLSGSREFTLSFKTDHNEIIGVRTERTDDAVLIHVTPENGIIDSRDFSFGLAEFPYDLIITLGAESKEAMGTLFHEIPDIFFDVPIVNIDNKATNEHFGQINILKLTASSLSEIIVDLCKRIADNHISSQAAACFLTGIIVATDSFRASDTTPHALSLSSYLIEKGADQKDIVTHLYKSQPLSLLQLWGRTMSKLQTSSQDEIITTIITQEDFDATDTDIHYIPRIITKIKQNFTTGKIFIVIYEKEDLCHALIDTERSGHLPDSLFGKQGDDGFYRTQFDSTDCANGREELAAKITHELAKLTK